MTRTPSHRTQDRLAVYLRATTPSGESAFFPVTDRLGEIVPFDRPHQVMVMATRPEDLRFSLRHLSKRAADRFRQTPLSIPTPTLVWLGRTIERFQPQDPLKLVVVREDDIDHFQVRPPDSQTETTWHVEPEGDGGVWQLEERPLRVGVFGFAARANRPFGLGFTGFLGKPGSQETPQRVVSKILNAATGLPEFRAVTGWSGFYVPPVSRFTRHARPTPAPPTVEAPVTFHLYDNQFTYLGSQNVTGIVRLDQVDPIGEDLLTSLGQAGEQFEPFRTVAERAFQAAVREITGETYQNLVLDALLGEVTAAQAKELLAKLAKLPVIELTPTRFRFRRD